MRLDATHHLVGQKPGVCGLDGDARGHIAVAAKTAGDGSDKEEEHWRHQERPEECLALTQQVRDVAASDKPGGAQRRQL
ncbi:MAG: hypothetical protein P8Y29_09035 [Gemmatimonadota bacterium]